MNAEFHPAVLLSSMYALASLIAGTSKCQASQGFCAGHLTSFSLVNLLCRHLDGKFLHSAKLVTVPPSAFFASHKQIEIFYWQILLSPPTTFFEDQYLFLIPL